MRYSIPALFLPLLAACQSFEGPLSVEARAIVLDDQEVDATAPGSTFDDEDLDVSGYGVEVAVWTPVVDVIGGVDIRELGDEETPELRLGLRRRFLEVSRLHPYVAADLRYGVDLDTGIDDTEYVGLGLGLGLLLDLTDHWFVDARLAYETTIDDPELGDEDARIDGLLGTLGLGYSF